jgi:hypothetical protein
MIKTVIHITLSVLLLLTATGLTINMHYCHDQLIDLALIAPAKSCCETDGHDDPCGHDAMISNMSHCEDETIKFESTCDYVVPLHSISFETTRSFDLFFSTTLSGNNRGTRVSSSTAMLNFKKPPAPREVILSEIQSFLI